MTFDLQSDSDMDESDEEKEAAPAPPKEVAPMLPPLPPQLGEAIIKKDYNPKCKFIFFNPLIVMYMLSCYRCIAMYIYMYTLAFAPTTTPSAGRGCHQERQQSKM